MFQLTKDEWSELSAQIQDFTQTDSLRSQIVTLKNGRGQHLKYLPYVLTEQGGAMLSSVLSSEKAVQMNIAIMRAFVKFRKILLVQWDIRDKLLKLQDRLDEHDVQLNHIYEALENLLDEKAAQQKWEDRDRIGFK